jgi:hypothetical protein
MAIDGLGNFVPAKALFTEGRMYREVVFSVEELNS